MRALLVALASLVALGCEISPVVSTPDPPGSRYSDCDRAAKDYCEYVIGIDERDREDLRRCVAEYRFECVSAGSGTRLFDAPAARWLRGG